MKLSTKQQLLKESNSELKRLRKLAGLSESKKPLNENISQVLNDVSKSQSENIYDDLSAMKEKFFAEQTKKLNNLYKTELQQYVGKEVTSDIIYQLRSRIRGGSASSTNIGKKIISMSFVVQQGWDEFEIRFVVKLEGGKSIEFSL